MTIPKLIHQTIGSALTIDSTLSNNIDLLENINRGWTHTIYEDKDCRRFIGNHYGYYFLKLFDKFHHDYGSAKADWFRYLLMYEFGGVYLDIKSSCLVPLDTVLNDSDEFILSHWSSKWGKWGRHDSLGVAREYQQWHIISKPKHPYLKAVISLVKDNIDNYDPIRDGIGQIAVLKLTGPIAYTMAIEPIVDHYSYRMVNIEDLHFVYSIVTDRNGKSTHKELLKSVYRKSKKPIVRVAPHKYAMLLLNRLLCRSSS